KVLAYIVGVDWHGFCIVSSCLHPQPLRSTGTMKTLIVSTPVGPFNRKTDSRYTFVNVWASPRAAAVAASPNPYRGGVDGRWVKDRGFAVTWHGSEAN